MIANVRPKIQIVDTHESLGKLITIDVAVGAAQFNRTLVIFVPSKTNATQLALNIHVLILYNVMHLSIHFRVGRFKQVVENI